MNTRAVVLNSLKSQPFTIKSQVLANQGKVVPVLHDPAWTWVSANKSHDPSAKDLAMQQADQPWGRDSVGGQACHTTLPPKQGRWERPRNHTQQKRL